MAFPGFILPRGRHLFAKIVDGLPEYQQCPICGMWFLEMSDQQGNEAHIDRCVARKAEDARKMIALGYKQTSKGWVR